MKLSRRLNSFPEYLFASLPKKFAEVEKRTGKKVLSFGQGSPTFPPAERNIAFLKSEFSKPKIFQYPKFGGDDDFNNSLISWYKERFDVDLNPDEVYPINGSKDAISHLPLVFLDERDEVLVPDPGYPNYAAAVSLMGGIAVSYNLTKENNFKPDYQELQTLVNTKTRYIIVNYPSNPLGQVADRTDLQQLVDFALKNKIWIVYDNAYADLAYDGYKSPSIFQIEGARDIAVELGSFSKMFSYAGFRIGWITGNASIIKFLAKVKTQVDFGMPTPFLKLASYSLSNFDKEWHTSMVADYKSKRDNLVPYLRNLGLQFEIPKAGMFIWAKIPDGYSDSDQYSEEMLNSKSIYFTPGSLYGKNGDRYVRISFVTEVDNLKSYL